MSFNEHCFIVVFTACINFINSFRFDTSFNFLLYILNNTSEIYIFAWWNRIPIFLNEKLVSSLTYHCDTIKYQMNI